MKAIEAFISGRVQGVGFRYFTFKLAKELGVKGYVKNLPDGRVYVYAVADEMTLEKFISSLPTYRNAVVRSVEVRDAEVKSFNAFEVRY